MYIQIATWPIWQINNWLSHLNGSLHISMLLTGFTGKQTKAQLDLASYFMASARVDVVSKGMLEMLKLDTRELFPTIITPTLVLGGDHDIMTKPEVSIYISTELPHSTLHIIPNAGHMGLLEQHEEYTKLTD